MSSSSSPSKQAPANTAPEQSEKSGVVAAASPAVRQKYYRIRKITGYLHEIVEVEIDETEIVPKVVSKQDLRECLMVRLEDFVYKEAKKS